MVGQTRRISKWWIKELEFYQVISYFYLFQVKRLKIRGRLIIVLSAIVSTISLIQFDKDEDDADSGSGDKYFGNSFTTFITLIAADEKTKLCKHYK